MTDTSARDVPAVACHGLSVVFGAVTVLEDVGLQVAPGEACAVLGPSGAGKSTLLHAVAGFVAPARGTVHIAGRVVASPGRSRPPETRAVGMVFQHYALWPHLSALDTVAYPLRRRGVGARAARVEAMGLLERMGIAELADRRPAEMSGGQQQRVGLARALARDAGLYLFDEPTAHLDTALRESLQIEMVQRRRERGAAALYATHDAGEALAIADQVVVLRDGRVVQTGAPRTVYEQPHDRSTALLTGPASMLDVTVRGIDGGQVVLDIAGVRTCVEGGGVASGAPLLRPEWADLGGPIPAKVAAVAYRGPHTDYRLDTPAGMVDVRRPGPPDAAVGEPVGVTLRRVWVVADPTRGSDEARPRG